MRIAVCLFVVGFAGATQAWALPECPASHDITLSGSVVGTFYGGTVQSHAITMHPCEEFWIDLSATEGDPNRNPYITVGAYNSVNTNLAGTSWTVDSSLSVQDALPLPGGGFPHVGTRHARSIVTRIDVSTYWARTQYPISYTLTVHFRARPEHNRGGLSYQDAYGPVAHGTTLHASMVNLEDNYYRVSLLPGGTLTLSGVLVNENWTYGVVIRIDVYSMAQQNLAIILNQSVPNNAAHDPNGVTVTFTSSTFTNTSSSAQDFYIKIGNGPGAWLHDSTITFWGDLIPPPVLTLFLDADGNFNTANPSSDHLSYIPGAELSSGASVSLPQAVRLIAAYVNSSGQIVPPPSWAPSIRFTLSDTSRFVGVAMNWGNQTDDDFQLPASTASFDVNDNTARAWLNCNDYGGFTTVAATDEVSAPGFRLPYDGAVQNWLPNVGWYTSTGPGIDQGAAGDDSDSTPTANGAPGDGLSAFEEFRGFMVMGNHIRTNPAFKDIFVYSQFTVEGLGNAWTLPVAPHQINQDELDGYRRIAPNYQNSGSGGNIPGHFVGTKINGTTSEQLAIVVFDDQTLTDVPANGPVTYGQTDGQLDQGISVEGPPWTIGPYAARVFTIRIRKASPTSNSPSIVDTFDSAKLDQTIAHEIGHNLNIDHVDWSLACPPYADTVMVINYFLPTGNGNDCAWNHIPFLYSLVDIGNLKVR